MWTSFSDQFVDIIARLESHTDLVDAEALATDFGEAYRFRLAARREFQEAAKERQRRAFDDAKMWLLPLSFEDDMQRFQDKIDGYPGTGQWLLQLPKFKAWAEGNTDSILWLSGIPGSGWCSDYIAYRR